MSLDIFQQVFCLAVEVCSAAKQTGTAVALQQTLAKNFIGFLSNPDFSGWQLSTAFPPAVWQSPYSDVIDQALAVSILPPAGNNPGYYVVSIAATSPASPFMVYMEDLAAAPTYLRPHPATNAGNLSYGNYVALQALLNLTSNNQTLGAYLASVANSQYNLVFCGHSLGGGLTPLLQYALYPKGTSGSGWQNVYGYPTAGPCTADSGFQTAYNSAYPKVTPPGSPAYGMWNANMYNTHDLVPNAWSIATAGGPNLTNINAGILKDTDCMFYTNVSMLSEVDVLQKIATQLVAIPSNPYMQINNNGWFTGTRSQGQITTNAMLGAEILYQHTTAYDLAYNVTSLFSDTSSSATIHPSLLAIARSAAGTGNAAAAQKA